ncbi:MULTISPECIES: amidohydrolase family protein [Sphingobium]|uniref:amidohydrolase family protein n=1 Tax=Sphingobium TaxID=165695 RepID=UPI002100C979|nr:amidohydrolase family protein [Sphingobium sp. 15-1]
MLPSNFCVRSIAATCALPTGKNVEGKPILYASMEMEPLWQAAEEAGLPINYHVGENASAALEEPGGIGTVVLSTFMPFRRNMGELMFGGIFDRHPPLRIVFAEANINWIPGMLQDAEMACDGWGKLLQPKLERRPTEYWQRHCYATIMSDKVGLGLIDYIGADRVMWSNDYPHNEGTHGYTAEIIEQILGAVPADQAKAILGGTAMQLYDLA